MDARIYKCFIASPQDTENERSICEKVFSEINRTLGAQFHFRIESVRWEKDAVPGFSNDAQTLINNQLTPAEQDFFIGIMWKIFGTATARAGSGTEEEFNQAYERWEKNKAQRIKFYFNEAPPPELKQIDADQYAKVKAFQQKVARLGGLYHSYHGPDKFEDALREHLNKELLSIHGNINKIDPVNKLLEDRLTQSLSLFSSQPVTWINRVLCRNDAIIDSLNRPIKKTIPAEDLLQIKSCCVVKSPPQFGLTSLSHYLVKKAREHNQSWVYLDFDKTKIKKIEEKIAEEKVALQIDTIECIILDSWGSEKVGSQKFIEVLESLHAGIPLIVMQTVTDSLEAFQTTKIRTKNEFQVFNLLALPRSEVRRAVAAYAPRILEDENTVLNKLILDLDTLNIHRTPMNCWTLLKVAERNSDKSPVNRTQLLEMVLSILFSLNELPSYETTPDSKDCEHALGNFCETLIRSSRIYFSKQELISATDEFCKKTLVDLNIGALWEVLFANRIIVQITPTDFRFKASFWIYYFAAKQMANNQEFKNYILKEKRYAAYPEIIEFYTGIDRNKTEVLNILREDLETTRSHLEAKIGISGILNPLGKLSWKPKDENIEKMKEALSNEVINSNVPESIKDQHADKSYNHLVPYNQDIRKFLDESSFAQFIYQLQAISRALRNSDYADVDTRKASLKSVVNGWTEVSKVLFVLTPILTQKGYASFEGFGFHLSEEFHKEEVKKEDLFLQILQSNPSNVIDYVKNDLSSKRMGSLFSDLLTSSLNDLQKHLIILYLISERPNDWAKHVDHYIVAQDKNSLYLLNTFYQLAEVYKYSTFNTSDDAEMCRMMKKCLAKHRYSIQNPEGASLNKISHDDLPKKPNENEVSPII